MQNQNLELHFLHQVSACLNLCRAHPLFEELLPHAQTFDYRLLEAYPYVEYQKLPTRTDCYTTISTADQVRCRYRIVVDERDVRCRIVSTTDAYSVGCRLPQVSRERYQLECVPIPDEFMQLYCITSRRGTRPQRLRAICSFCRRSWKTKTRIRRRAAGRPARSRRHRARGQVVKKD